MKTREQLLQDIGEAVRTDVSRMVKSGLAIMPEYVSYRTSTREAITSLAKFEYEQLKEKE